MLFRFLIVFSLFFIFLILPPVGFLVYCAYEVFWGDRSHLEEDRILKILEKESLIFYRDGVTQLGSLFVDHHRQYVKLDDVPRYALDAILSAEDARFYRHHGIDFYGLSRAIVRNFLKKGGRPEGASTITNQTVKNLYGRQRTNYYTKFLELINSLKLELMYSKEQILEFYVNQFHVVGNGLGLAIAAKYYFDKDVTELTLNEAAFIAASLKAPKHYNPFNQPTEERRLDALEKGFLRKNYVLKRMFENQLLSEEEYEAAQKEQVHFQRGSFQFNNLTLVQMVEEQLKKPEILEAIGATSYEELKRLGLRITTTLDPLIQGSAVQNLRATLSQMELALSDYQPPLKEEMQKRQNLEIGEYYVGKLEQIQSSPPKALVSFQETSCLLNQDSFFVWEKALNHQKKLKNSRQLLNQWFDQVKEGDPILVSVREKKRDQFVCDIRRLPDLQGAALVLEQSRVRGLVGGFSSNGYNRAVYARRQPGSTFKSVIFHIASQLGWTVQDSLPNFRMSYPWKGGRYYPRPDHRAIYLYTNLLGAGAKSENLASVWLSLHCLDQLNESQYRDFLSRFGLFRADRPLSENLSFLERKFQLDLKKAEGYKAGLFQKLKEKVILESTDLNFTQKALLIAMHYGGGAQEEDQRLKAYLTHQKTPEESDLDWDALNLDEKAFASASEKELIARQVINSNHLTRWNQIRLKVDQILTALEENRVLPFDAVSLEEEKERFHWYEMVCESCEVPLIAYVEEEPLKVKVFSDLLEEGELRPLREEDLRAYWVASPESFDGSVLLLDGLFPLDLVARLYQSVEEDYERLVREEDGYQLLRSHEELNSSFGLYYITQYLKRIGVKNYVPAVPSLALGACDITPAELALAFQTFATGEVYHFFTSLSEETSVSDLLVIERIEDHNGHLLWEAIPRRTRIVPEEESAPILSVLRSSVLSGTARGVSNVLLKNDWFERARIPTFAKTGTTNKHTNAIFTGFLPFPLDEKSPLTPEQMYTISVYLGYDQNQPMVRDWLKIYGANGALPCWKGIAQDLVHQLPSFQNYQGMVNQEGVRTINFQFPEGVRVVSFPLFNENLYQEIWGTEDRVWFHLLKKSNHMGVGAFRFQLLDGLRVPKRMVHFFRSFSF